MGVVPHDILFGLSCALELFLMEFKDKVMASKLEEVRKETKTDKGGRKDYVSREDM